MTSAWPLTSISLSRLAYWLYIVFHLQEEYYGREVILADRDMVEQESDTLFEDADTDDIAFLVVGDPFG